MQILTYVFVPEETTKMDTNNKMGIACSDSGASKQMLSGNQSTDETQERLCNKMTSRKVRMELTGVQKRAWSIGFMIFLVILWQVLAMIIGKSYILPSPIEVIESLWKNRAEIFTEHLPATMLVMAIGCAASIIIGVGLAVLMDVSKTAQKALYPILTFTQTIPIMCISPVFVLWFGYSTGMRALVVVLVTFFSITVNVFDGFKASKRAREELLQTYGADRWQCLKLVKWPAALPYFFTALHVAVPWSAVGAAVAEWLGAPKGLGTYSRNCMASLDAAGLLAPLILLTVIALLLNYILNILERRFVSWQDVL